jgi:hypothetical protein
MADPVTLHDRYYLIDTHAWLEQRAGARHDTYSTQLQDFTRCDVFDRYEPTMDTAARLQLWCAAHGFALGESPSMEHDEQCLTAPVTIVLATTASLPDEALALVSVDGGLPQVYADVTDESFWRTAATIAITCPAGHCWTWDGDRYLYAADGSEQHVTVLFARDASVISNCRDCLAFEDGDSDDMCRCPGYAVYCPRCTTRCQVGLPQIPAIGRVPA